jgi:hypothetical protein
MDKPILKIKGYMTLREVRLLKASHKKEVLALGELLSVLRDNLAHYTRREEELMVETRRLQTKLTISESDSREKAKEFREELRKMRAAVTSSADAAEEGAIAAGNSSRVAIRLMEHVDEYVEGLKSKVRDMSKDKGDLTSGPR